MRALAVALLVACALAGSVAASTTLGIGVDPAPRAGETVTVRIEGVANATAVTLAPCVGQQPTVRFCYPPGPMSRGADGTWSRAVTLAGTQAGEALGVRATARNADGTNLTLPLDGGYSWFAIESAASTPLPALALAVAALALAAGARRR